MADIPHDNRHLWYLHVHHSVVQQDPSYERLVAGYYHSGRYPRLLRLCQQEIQDPGSRQFLRLVLEVFMIIIFNPEEFRVFVTARSLRKSYN